MTKHIQYLIAICCILVGTLIYMGCRSDILFLNWIGVEGNVINTKGHPFLYWSVYCLPDGLWYMSLLLIEGAIYRSDVVWSRIVWYIAILLPFILELCQLLGWVAGTFDMVDITTYIFTLILFLLCKRKQLF